MNSSKKEFPAIILLFLIVLASCQPSTLPITGEELELNFIDPPSDAGPETWWHWMNGNISKEGITRDLEELADKGYRGATMFSIGHNIDAYYSTGPVKYMSQEWYDLAHHAITEAQRLELKLTFHNSDGWATSGGPWVAPDDAMKELVYSVTDLKGPANLEIELPEPQKIENYYRDIAVLAYPARKPQPSFMETNQVVAEASISGKELPYMFDNNPTSFASFTDWREVSDQHYIELSFPEPVKVSKLLLYQTRIWGQTAAQQCELYARDRNNQYQSILKFKHQQPYSLLEFKETEASQFKLVFHSFFRFDNYIVKQQLKIQELQLLPAGMDAVLPRISDWDNKAGYRNFRVDGDYLPPKQLIEDEIISQDEQIDLTGKFMDGKLTWEVPAGDWKIIRLGYTVTGKPNEPSTDEGRGLECDKLSAKSVTNYFNGLPDQILQKNQIHLGDALQGMLIDSWEAGSQNWTGNFPEEFIKRRGYSIHPWLLVLTGQVVESVESSERFLWDFRRTIADMIAENYYGTMKELCNQNGILLQAEAAHVALQFLVDGINYHRLLDIPMNEFWIEPDKIGYNIRPGFSDAPSAAHLYNKKIVACESFTCAQGNWRHSPFWLKPAADKVFSMGVNRITFDTYTHQPDERKPGWNLAPWGTAHNWKLTWWSYEKPWIQYLSRCQYLLQQGDHVADFLVFTGEGVPSFLPVQFGNNNGLLPNGYAFDGCNQETLLSRLTVKDGKLILPHGPSYQAILLPEETRMTPELTKGIAALVKAGASIFGPKPLTSPSLLDFPDCDQQVLETATLAWGAMDGKEGKVHAFGKGRTVQGSSPDQMIDILGLKPDFTYHVLSGNADLEFIHKNTDQLDFYFLSNQHQEEAATVCSFRIMNKKPELWFPDEGRIDQDISFRINENRIELPIDFDAYGSVFVVFREDLSQEEIQVAENQTGPFIAEQEIIDSLMITGPWSVAFPDGMGAPESIHLAELASWTVNQDKDIKYYSGTAIYSNTINLADKLLSQDKSLCLDLGMVKEIAEVWINGQNAGILWKPPFRIDVGAYLRSGENDLKIHVVNTWTNRLIGDLFLPEDQRHTWVNCCLPLNKSSELMESGLLGPVGLIVQAEK